jgi:glycosyltransferase involved in cell wall biosynthesis
MNVISVIIPALDEEGQIGDCLKSLQGQTRQADQIIVVDNGSVDATAEVARACGAEVLFFPRPDRRHGSIGLVRQVGVEAARGNIIVSTDADCVYPQDWLQKIDTYFTENPELVLLGGPAFPKNHDVWNDCISGLGNWGRSYIGGWGIPYFLGGNTSYRKEAFELTDGYKGAASHGPLEEWVLSFRLSRVGAWVWDDNLLVYTYIPDWSRAYNAALPLTAAPLAAWIAATIL